ncbi:MAG: response regulator [Methanobacteriota archaeon]
MTKKVMIVDDEPDVRTSVGQILKINGYTIIEGENGADCLEKLQSHTPDLLILDIMMPGMSGWDVAAKMKENKKWRDIPIVFLTAKGDDMSIGMGSIAAKDYIVKPFDLMDFKHRIEKILKK